MSIFITDPPYVNGYVNGFYTFVNAGSAWDRISVAVGIVPNSAKAPISRSSVPMRNRAHKTVIRSSEKSPAGFCVFGLANFSAELTFHSRFFPLRATFLW